MKTRRRSFVAYFVVAAGILLLWPLSTNAGERLLDDPASADTSAPDPPDYHEVVDMGAFEFQLRFGDLTGDGDGDLSDLATLLAYCGQTCPP